MPSRLRTIATAALVAVLLAACTASGGPYLVGQGGLRTFPVTREVNGVVATCGMAAVEPHVAGVLQGSPVDVERVWLTGESGQRLSVVWPEGYGVSFEPEAVLVDESGRVVARDGDKVSLDQVAPDSAAGTFEDPYIASCFLFGKTYPYIPSTATD